MSDECDDWDNGYDAEDDEWSWHEGNDQDSDDE